MSVCTSALAERYPLVVIPAGRKGPLSKAWPDKWPSFEEVNDALAMGQNLGIILGPRSGLVDVEVDGPQGEASLRELFDGEPPETVCWVSLRGRHRLYAYDERFADLGAKLTHRDYPGLEFRIGAEAAQSLIPPSIVDGLQRQWEIDLHDNEPATLPETIIEKILALKVAPPTHSATDEFDFGFADAKLADLEIWHRRVGLDYRVEARDAKYHITFPHCPIRGPQHTDGDATTFVNEDGSHAFFCHHTKCSGKTFADLEAIYGPFSAPVIKAGPDIHRVTAEAIHALRGAPNVYQRGLLVEVTHDAPKPKLCLADNGAPRLRQIPCPTLGLLLSEHGRFRQRNRDGDWVPCAPPARIVSAVDAAADLPGIPVISGIISAPVLRADGSVLTSPGYDLPTGLYLDTLGAYPPLMRPSVAISMLLDILADFPFESDAHRSAWIAALVTLHARPAFPGPAPLFLFDANASRAGKGLLTDLLTMIFEGRKAARYAAPDRDEEARKLITSIAISGAPYLIFDNLKDKFGGQAIENAMTAGRWSDRLLGTNKHVDIPLSFVWLATSNNATLTQDMIGRTCHCRLNTPLERPDQRTDFRYADLLGHVKENRAELAVAALSIPAAYIRAGRPKQNLKGWGGFEGWSDLVRSSLVWAGLADPDTRTTLAEQADDETATLQQLLDGWEEIGFPATVATALSCADRCPSLAEAIKDLSGDKNHALGNLLRRYRGRVVSGRYFQRTDEKKPKWQVCYTGDQK